MAGEEALLVNGVIDPGDDTAGCGSIRDEKTALVDTVWGPYAERPPRREAERQRLPAGRQGADRHKRFIAALVGGRMRANA